MFGHVKIRNYICTRYPNHNLFTLRTNTYKNIEWSVAKWATFIFYRGYKLVDNELHALKHSKNATNILRKSKYTLTNKAFIFMAKQMVVKSSLMQASKSFLFPIKKKHLKCFHFAIIL